MPTNPCCCTECVIYRDSFTTDSIAGSWDDVSGSWSIAAGVLSIEDTSALIVANELHPGGDYQPQNVKVNVRFDTAEDIARVVIAYEDVDNYLFAEWWIGADNCGHVQMYERITGTDTAIGDEYAVPFEVEVDVWATISLCYVPGESVEDPGALTTRVAYNGHVWNGTAATSPDLPGDQGGLGTGATVAGTIDFDEFFYQYYYDAVDHPTCPKCAGNQSCLLHSDDFNRSDTTTVGCAWEEVSGDWEIDTNELTIAAADAILLNRTQLRNEDGDFDGHVTVSFLWRCEAGAILRVILDYADSSNYFYVKIEPSSHGDSGRVTFWRVIAGVETQVGTESVVRGIEADTEDMQGLLVCWRDDGIVRVRTLSEDIPGHWAVDLANPGFTARSVTALAAEPCVALGTGSGGSSQVWFDDFSIEQVDDDPEGLLAQCSTCPVQSCQLASDADYDGDLWTVDAGSWTLTSSTAATSSSDAMLLSEVGHPQTTSEGHLDLTSAGYAEFETTGFSNAVRVLLGVQDDANYIYGEVEFSPDSSSTGFVRVGKVEAGVDTVITEEDTSVSAGQPNSGTHSLRVCYDGLELRAIFTNANGTSAPVPAIGTAGTGWNPGTSGLATGTLSAAVTFGDFFLYHDIFSGETSPFNPFTCIPCTPSLQCGICGTNEEGGSCTDRSPQILLLRLAGMPTVADSDNCADLAQFNDTFALPFDSASGSGAGAYCIWLMHPDFCINDIDEPSTIQFKFTKIGSGDTQIEYEAKVTGAADDHLDGVGIATWSKLSVQADFASGEIFNPTCLDEAASETVWGLDCLTTWANWISIDESYVASGWLNTGATPTAEFKVLA